MTLCRSSNADSLVVVVGAVDTVEIGVQPQVSAASTQIHRGLCVTGCGRPVHLGVDRCWTVAVGEDGRQSGTPG